MDDLISRQATIDKAITIPVARIVTEDKVIWRKAVFVEDIEALPSAQPGWISVTEALPLNYNDVLVTDGENCEVAYWNEDAKAWDSAAHGWVSKYMEEIVAWQPLPTVSKGGQE